ncbi:class I SAM-dependent methyltransferase [Aestuariibacter salexigens]|uniref:class I SAM-dependent methyltransferase n=1 Tax=Aestuariibacter salexigens TaxID=226010 RepID=UPI00040B9F98|nr:class I SAM-dependent methyltransferase [Aestuariibacter salexigens]
MQQQKNWSEYWQKEGEGGDVFVTADGSKQLQLQAFWQKIFEHHKPTSVLDIASGAGAVFSNLESTEQYHLVATDISVDALVRQRQRVDGVQTVVCDAANISLGNAQFDLVVSQFGIEYAGPEAFSETARLLKPAGSLTLLCHFMGGYIVSSALKQELAGAQLCQQTGFIEKAKQLVVAMSTGEKRTVHQAMDVFTEVEPVLAKYCAKVPEGIHSHLYNGFKQLMIKRQHYDQQDIISWLENVQGEVDKCILRLSEMCQAALTQQHIDDIKQRLTNAGLRDIQAEPFYLPKYQLPVAWHIHAKGSKK